MAPVVGILGTPVINTSTNNGTTTGTIYLVVEQQPSSTSFTHTLWALDITTLSTTTGYVQNVISLGSGCSENSQFSQLHIQRPALLLGSDNYLYIAFSMMDGNPVPLPNGMMLAFNTVGLTNSSTPLCLPLSLGSNNNDGAGIWMGGGGPAFGPDALNGSKYTYFNTGNGVFDHNSNWGDTFVRMYNNATGGPGGTPILQFSDWFTPGDQFWRSNKVSTYLPTCSPDGDVDFGSGGVMLVPEAENSTNPFLAVSGDKEGGIWFMNRASPGQGGTTQTCAGSGNTNVQTYPINGSSFSKETGPLIHTNPAFWETGSGTNYLFLGSSEANSNSGAGQLMQYQICGSGQPINSSPCSTTGVAASNSSGAVLFPWGTTPSISAASDSDNDAVLWAIWADGSVVPSTKRFQYKPPNGPYFPVAESAVLYAFDAVSMSALYSSASCPTKDPLNPATKYSIPTVANGYVYLGTQGPPQNPDTCSPADDPSASCFNAGTFYVFGQFNNRSCS